MVAFNGNAVKELRKANGMKQREVAAALGVGRATVCRFESGERGKRISYQHLIILSELFAVPIDTFYVNPAETP
jgi:transcriptional regulator with XRE-family HTH domain